MFIFEFKFFVEFSSSISENKFMTQLFFSSLVKKAHNGKSLKAFKKLSVLICTFAIVLFNQLSFAQINVPPYGINYQAVARDTMGKPMANYNNLAVKFTIFDSVSGAPTIAFTEIHNSVTTNRYGLFTLIIGSVQTASFQGITWNAGKKYLQVEISTTGGSNYVSMGKVQLMSVPYALYSKTSESSINNWSTSGNIAVSGDYIGTNNSQDLVFKTNTGERMRLVDATGNLGIGTTPSPGAKLEVSGQVKITGGSPGVGKVLTSDGVGLATWSSPADSGTVTSFSAGDLVPLFTTSEATPTTTPALSFTLSNANPLTVLGNNTNTASPPTYITPTLAGPLFQNQGTATTNVLHGNQSGTLTWSAVNLLADVSGILPIANGGTNTGTTASAGTVYYSDGAKHASTAVGASGKILTSTGAGTPIWTTPDTGVTIVNGNVPIRTSTPNGGGTYVITVDDNTALLKGVVAAGNGNPDMVWQTSSGGNPAWGQIVNANITNNTINLTTKVTGILPIARGGTNIGTIGGPGAVIYSNGTQHASTGVGTSGQVLTSAGAGTPIWSTPTTGSVTSIATGTGLTGGPITTSGTISLVTPVTTANGGTGAATLTNHGVLIGQGVSAIVATAVGATNTVLHGNTGADPTFSTIVNADITSVDASKITGILPIANGGTNIGTLGVAGTVIYSNGTQHASNALGTAGQVLTSQGSGAPTWTSISGGVTANNGLSMVGGNVGLDGTLIRNTVVNQSTFSLTLGGGTGTININESSTTALTHIGTGTTTGTITIGNANNQINLPRMSNSSFLFTDGSKNITTTPSAILPLANGGTNANLTAVAGGVVWSDGNGMQINIPGVATTVLTSTGGGAPIWLPPNVGTVTSVTGTPPISVAPGTPNPVVSMTANSATTDGYVTTALGQANKVWRTNAAGVPTWRADSATAYTGGTGITITGTTINSVWIKSTANVNDIYNYNSGNVVIGDTTTTTPTLFHVASSTAAAGITTFEQANTSADGYDLNIRKARTSVASPAVVSPGDELGNINFLGFATTGGYTKGAAIKAIAESPIGPSKLPAYLSFWTAPSATGVLTERLRINNAGNVGIGSTSPMISQTYTNAGGLLTIQNTTGSILQGVLELANLSDADGQPIGDIAFSASSQSGAVDFRSALIRGALSGGSANNRGSSLAFSTRSDGGINDLVERMRIDSVGNVGIGTSVPVANAKLAIKNGHLQSQQTTAPTILFGPSATVATLTNATDIAGNLSVTPDGTTGVGAIITFNKTYSVAPIVTLTAKNADAATDITKVFVTTTTTGFSVNYFGVPFPLTTDHQYSYHVVETQ